MLVIERKITVSGRCSGFTRPPPHRAVTSACRRSCRQPIWASKVYCRLAGNKGRSSMQRFSCPVREGGDSPNGSPRSVAPLLGCQASRPTGACDSRQEDKLGPTWFCDRQQGLLMRCLFSSVAAQPRCLSGHAVLARPRLKPPQLLAPDRRLDGCCRRGKVSCVDGPHLAGGRGGRCIS